MRTILIAIFCLVFSFSSHAYKKRDLLQKSIDRNSLRNSLILNQQWVGYPSYSDRAGWDRLTGGLKQEIISRGEEALNFDWKVVKATDYLEFERSGNRNAMQTPFGANREALGNLVMAELAEGKGRFLDQIANGIWYFCEKTSWVQSAHMSHHTRSKRSSLPDHNEFVIDLQAGDVGSFLAWTYYFLKDALADKISPFIPQRLLQNLQERILEPYMKIDYGYLALNATPLTKVNNWNPWVNFNVISTYLLIENDPEKLTSAVYRSLQSMDGFINYYHDDGATEEGTSYFSHAVGKMYDYLQILQYAGAPVSFIFSEPLIRQMGEFVSRAYIGDGWVVNFSDASPRFSAPLGVVFRYGEATGSEELKQFASYLYQRTKDDRYILSGTDVFRTLENMKSHTSVISTPPAISPVPYTWYPQTELLYIRQENGFFFSAKGGTNQQSHNHNDVGSFVLFYRNNPVFIDAGVGTYTAQTFSSERYSIWTMQSNYHNIPVINGVPQRSLGLDRSPEEEKYSARNVRFDPGRNTFSADISGSYHPDSKAESWVRRYTLNRDGRLFIEDDFVLTEATKPNQVNFMTQAKPDISVPGKVRLEIQDEAILLEYEAARFEAVVEELPPAVRGYGTLYRTSLNARVPEKKGKYRFVAGLERK